MADQEGRRRIALSFAHKIGQLLHEVRPVVGDGVPWIVAEPVDHLDLEAALAQTFMDHPVGAAGEAVAVRENDAREHAQISFSSGVVIFLSRVLR